MANPVFFDLPADEWVLVAEGVTSGQVSVVLTKPDQLLTAYRMAGDTNIPTNEDDGIAMSRKSNQIRSRLPIDVYIRSQNEESRVRVDL